MSRRKKEEIEKRPLNEPEIVFKCKECKYLTKVVHHLKSGYKHTTHHCSAESMRIIPTCIVNKDIPDWCPNFPL